MSEPSAEAITAAAKAIGSTLIPNVGFLEPEFCEPLARRALEAAAPLITAAAVAAERERIRHLAADLKFTLYRPGPGNGPAHTQALDVVPLGELDKLLGPQPAGADTGHKSED
jgi:hypothetical protein